MVDFGIGIAKDDIEHVFDRFYKSKNPANKKLNPYGNGIGLSVSKQIAQSLGGDLTLLSTLNVLTCFSLLLPTQECKP